MVICIDVLSHITLFHVAQQTETLVKLLLTEDGRLLGCWATKGVPPAWGLGGEADS